MEKGHPDMYGLESTCMERKNKNEKYDFLNPNGYLLFIAVTNTHFEK